MSQIKTGVTLNKFKHNKEKNEERKKEELSSGTCSKCNQR